MLLPLGQEPFQAEAHEEAAGFSRIASQPHTPTRTDRHGAPCESGSADKFGAGPFHQQPLTTFIVVSDTIGTQCLGVRHKGCPHPC